MQAVSQTCGRGGLGSLRAQRASGVLEGEVAEDHKAIFKVRREKTARALADESVELREAFPEGGCGH